MVDLSLPLKRTTELRRKFVPVIVRVKPVPPAKALEGEREAIVGPGVGVTVKVTGAELTPPEPLGLGLNTVTGKVPSVEVSVARIVVANSVALRNRVTLSFPLTRTTELGRKFVPVTVRVKPAPPAKVLEGEREAIVGGGVGSATVRKTVTVCANRHSNARHVTEPDSKVPRTVNWAGPTGTVASTCTGKEPGSPTVTLPGVTWVRGGRLGKSMDTVPAKPEIGTTRTESDMVSPGLTGMRCVAIEGGVTVNVKSLITLTKRVAVFTRPVPKVPRTVRSAGPGTAAGVTRTGKEPVALAATFPGVARKPAGRFGKSMNTVPAKPGPGTTCTVRGRVLLCVTGAGALLVVVGLRLSEKSGCKTSTALTVAVMLPELSWPVMTSVKGRAPLKSVAVVGANTVKLIVPVGPEGFGVNWTSMDWLPILPWPVNVIDPLNPPMGTTANVPLT